MKWPRGTGPVSRLVAVQPYIPIQVCGSPTLHAGFDYVPACPWALDLVVEWSHTSAPLYWHDLAMSSGMQEFPRSRYLAAREQQLMLPLLPHHKPGDMALQSISVPQVRGWAPPPRAQASKSYLVCSLRIWFWTVRVNGTLILLEKERRSSQQNIQQYCLVQCNQVISYCFALMLLIPFLIYPSQIYIHVLKGAFPWLEAL